MDTSIEPYRVHTVRDGEEMEQVLNDGHANGYRFRQAVSTDGKILLIFDLGD